MKNWDRLKKFGKRLLKPESAPHPAPKVSTSNTASLSIQLTDLPNPKFDWSKDRIAIATHDEHNLLWLARKDPKTKGVYRDLMAHDYVLYMHAKGRSYLIKRPLVGHIWERTDLHQGGETFYTIQEPLPNKQNQLGPMRLAVVFSSMPPAADYYSSNLAKRMFVQNYPSLPKHLLKNTVILRIIDLNRNAGSYYMNTANYPTFETDVQQIIQAVMDKFQIDPDNVVLYGGSKGGSGALLHAIIGNYHGVVVDPIFNQTPYWQAQADLHYLQGILPEKLLPLYQQLLDTHPNTREITIIGSAQVQDNYAEYIKLKSNSIRILTVRDEHIKVHPDVSANTMIEQVTAMNHYLINSPKYLRD
ncbi:XcbB/CpsF family capsular polysaccharide biosynthesis protein [Lacticaseibacillus nasuensis]|uniref:XcbB/CpsF family capsular polysaccharide biosynthesis protein n=1 Tax=Lacticaseibacillus nasuensis TaxID=944671 RepID=UPI002247DBE2|nr:XcbB/CpsF family capsular polysaccharide biosynthesis protein [Lacticaseibacillus nasuensis]MCX2456199.1 XcbB/CpsF family capsular polysaccharide biosynthesis protein [Lacticaseibacillus nasuensis]